MNMCTRTPELNGAELAAARGNVAKFEPLHGWGSDKRHIEALTTGELYSLIEWLRERNANLSTGVKAQAKNVYAEGVNAGRKLGTCRFNCRTAKQNFTSGYVEAWREMGVYHTLSYHEKQDLLEEANDVWKRRQENPRTGLSSGLGKTLGRETPRDGDGIG